MAEGAPAAPPAENLPEFKAPEAKAPAELGPAADTGYTEQAAKAWFQLNNQLAGDKETFTNAQTTFNYNKALYAQKLPEEVGTQRFRAALGGFANSGTEARNQGRIQAGFVNKNTANLARFVETANRANRLAGEQVGGYNQNQGFQIGKAEERYKARTVKAGPQEPTAPAAATTGYGTAANMTSGPPAPGRHLVGEAGFVGGTANFGPGEVGRANARGTRQAAANKARKR